MSGFLHPEKQRVCKRCGHEWFAHQHGRLDSGWVISQRQAEQRREQYRSCPSCGSTKVRSFDPPKLVKHPSQPVVSRKLSKRGAKKQREALVKEREQRAAFEANAARQRQRQAGLRRKDVARAFAEPPVGQRVR